MGAIGLCTVGPASVWHIRPLDKDTVLRPAEPVVRFEVCKAHRRDINCDDGGNPE